MNVTVYKYTDTVIYYSIVIRSNITYYLSTIRQRKESNIFVFSALDSHSNYFEQHFVWRRHHLL